MLLWVVLATLPAPSKIPLTTGTTVSTSVPDGVPDIPIPNVYTLPLAEKLIGEACDRVAEPPFCTRDRKKSLASNDPLPPLVLYTASLKVTAMVLLSNARNTEEIIGTAWSFKVAVLLLWVVLASLPTAS